MNHGAPAATTARSGNSGSNTWSASRSGGCCDPRRPAAGGRSATGGRSAARASRRADSLRWRPPSTWLGARLGRLHDRATDRDTDRAPRAGTIASHRRVPPASDPGEAVTRQPARRGDPPCTRRSPRPARAGSTGSTSPPGRTRRRPCRPPGELDLDVGRLVADVPHVDVVAQAEPQRRRRTTIGRPPAARARTARAEAGSSRRGRPASGIAPVDPHAGGQQPAVGDEEAVGGASPAEMSPSARRGRTARPTTRVTSAPGGTAGAGHRRGGPYRRPARQRATGGISPIGVVLIHWPHVRHSPLRDRGPARPGGARHRGGGGEILRGVDLTCRGRRGPRPHGAQRLGQVDPGQHPARQPRVRGHAGRILFRGDDITDWETDVRGKAGIFLAFQYPQAIAGVSVINFLRQALSARKGIDLSVLELRLAIMEWMQRLDMDPSFADRYLNEGFSGGEKKRNEILQMAILEPEVAILDETDSGLDIDALKVVARGSRRSAATAPSWASSPSPTTSGCSTTCARPGPHPDRRAHRRQRRPRAGRAPRARGLRELALSDRLDTVRVTPTCPDRRRAARRRAHQEGLPHPRPGRAGQRLVYLDSANTSQKPRRARRHDRYYEQSTRQRPPGHLPHRRGGHRRPGGRPGQGRPLHRRPLHREVVFTKNATEALNLVAKAWGRANLRAGDPVVITEMEHHANIVPWHQLATRSASSCAGSRSGPTATLDLTDLDRLVDGAQGGVVRRHVQRARHDQPGRAAGRGRPRRRGARRGRRQPVRAPPAHRRAGLGRRLRRLHRPQDVRPTGIGVLWGTEDDPRRHPAVPHRRRDDPQRHQGGLHAQRAALEVRGRHAAHRRGRGAGRRRRLPRRAGHGGRPRARGGAHRLRAALAHRALRRRPRRSTARPSRPSGAACCRSPTATCTPTT